MCEPLLDMVLKFYTLAFWATVFLGVIAVMSVIMTFVPER